MKKEAEREARTMWEFICTFLKWLVIAGVTGGIGGLVGSAFHLSVNWAATFRAAHPWLLWLLPVGGLLIAAIYCRSAAASAATSGSCSTSMKRICASPRSAA